MYTSRVCQVLAAEHQATVELMERLAKLLGAQRATPPNVTEPFTQRLLRELPDAIEAELNRHFDFEEAALFSLLGEIGEAELGEHLTSEHIAMRPLLDDLITQSRRAAQNGFDVAGWQAFRRAGEQIVSLLIEHANKEDLMLLPVLEERLSADEDSELIASYMVEG